MSSHRTTPATVPGHIEITETLLRLYIFLAQHIDRCLDQTSGASLPEAELQAHLTATREQVMRMLAVNRVVKGKVEQECERVLGLATACLHSRPAGPPAESRQQQAMDRSNQTEVLSAERAVLKHKTIALSDLLAVFRAV
jgi:hypothetical protein